MRVVLSCTAMLIAALSFVSAVSATTLYVDQSAPGPTHDGLSWETAYLSIHAAAKDLLTGGEVWIASGTYDEIISVYRPNIALYGGFPVGGGTWESRDWDANETTIRGDTQNPVIELRGSGSYRVDGLTVTNGAPGILQSNSNLTITNCRITGNVGNGYNRSAAGIICSGGTITIENNEVSNNVNTQSSAMAGGAYCLAQSSLVIRNNMIADNSAGNGLVGDRSSGGGISAVVDTRLPASSGLIEGNTVLRNRAKTGGGVYASASLRAPIVIRNNTVSANTEGGIYGGLTVEDNIVTYNVGFGIAQGGTVRHNTIEDNQGSGIFVSGGTCEDNDIRRNVAVTGGGVIVGRDGGTVRGNRITDNIAQQGGGVYVDLECRNCLMSDNTIEDNQATQGGGIMVADGGIARIERSLIRGNAAVQGGACYDAYIVSFFSSVIADNTASEAGGGMYVESWCRPALINCTVVQNAAPTGGAMALVGEGHAVDIYNNIVAWNSSGLIRSDPGQYFGYLDANCLFQNNDLDYANFPPGTHDITADPQLVDPMGGDYRLMDESACIDAGLNYIRTYVTTESEPFGTDFYGDPRVCNGLGSAEAIVDIGADEYFTGTEIMSAPPGWFGPGWTWFSIPDQPLVPDAVTLLGYDGTNRVYGWDSVSQNLLLCPNDFTDLSVGQSYLTFINLGESYRPSYEGVPVTTEFTIPLHQGWNWVGLPSNRSLDLQHVRVQVGNHIGNSIWDNAQTAPAVNWNWIWWDPLDRTARMTCVYSNHQHTSDETWLHPWYGYRVWVNVPEATLVFPER